MLVRVDAREQRQVRRQRGRHRRHRPLEQDTLGGESVELALQALSNFQYSDLKLTVNRAAAGDTVALMQVKGKNPDFYGGHPVEFNLNISGKLDQILDRGLAGYRIPDTIREKLGDFAE